MLADETPHEEHDRQARDRDHPRIFIDDIEYRAPDHDMTGAELRRLARPPLGADRDLWREHRDGEDTLVEDDKTLELHNGERFFSTPKHINPGMVPWTT